MDQTYLAFYKQSYALVIGINAYQHVSPLSYACNDADTISRILISGLDFPKENVFILEDKKATKHAILERFLSFSEIAGDPDNRIFIFFAGHGHTVDGIRGPIGYLVPVDGNPDNKNTLIRWDDLTRNSELIPAKHILFIIDACYSGLALQRAIPPGSQRFLSDMLQRLSRQVITAGKSDEVVADGGGPKGQNSIFTGYLVEGLEGAAVDKNGILTASELMSYVYKKVGQDPRSQQTPHFGYIEGDGDFILRSPNGEHLNNNQHKEYLISAVGADTGFDQEQPSIRQRPNFLVRNGYGDPTSPNFGRNDWSKKLLEYRRGKNVPEETSRAFSWTSLIFEPVIPLERPINLIELSQGLKTYKPVGNQPFEQLVIPTRVMTTIDSLVLFDELSRDTSFWSWYIRVDKNGNIEFADTKYSFLEIDGCRCFFYVQLIGLIWQSLFFTKQLLQKAGYHSGIKFWLNLVGTRDSILIDFSKSPGENNQHWRTPFNSSDFFDSEQLFHLKCPDPNLQMDYQFVLDSLDQDSSFIIIKSIASNLGLAYNHQSTPRCFNCNTDMFPWKQYFEQRSW